MNSKSAKHLRTATTAYTSCILGSKNKSQVGAMSHCHQLDLYTKHARFIHKDTLSNQVCNWPKKNCNIGRQNTETEAVVQSVTIYALAKNRAPQPCTLAVIYCLIGITQQLAKRILPQLIQLERVSAKAKQTRPNLPHPNR